MPRIKEFPIAQLGIPALVTQRAELKFTGDQGSRLLLAWALNYIFSNEVRALHQ